MAEEISGADVIYAKLREGDLLQFDPLSSHSLRGDIEPGSDELIDAMRADLDGEPIILSDSYLVVDVKMTGGAHVEVSFLCMDGTGRGVTVEVFEALSTLGPRTRVIVGPTPMDCRGVLTPTGLRDRDVSLAIKTEKVPRPQFVKRGEHMLLALVLLVVGINLLVMLPLFL
jgi:hypothetical protein